MESSIPHAFLDTNVLFGALSANILLTLAERPGAMYRPLWSDYVMEELREHLRERIHPPAGTSDPDVFVTNRVEHRLSAMRDAFTKAEIRDWRRTMPGIRSYVDDPDDAPILAGALAGGADCLVTDNIRDFHVEDIERRFDMRVVRRGTFLTFLYHRDPDGFMSRMRLMVSRNRMPPHTLEELHDRLERDPDTGILADLMEKHVMGLSGRESSGMGRTVGQPRDRLGRFAHKPAVDDDLDDPTLGVWGVDGNGGV